ncbi:Fe-S cluster assembly protein SufB [archaeon]|nr:Fe-S cluster assembly protein SufB [archaeon]MDP6548333.1 Fe-S cluster assembly protein SufB [Candidatus Woesearchaeota archaeon]|tara:strand:+ start:14276 stop:15676 length:1401 start_codon:yes stop_codon:yes gene_type:complete
MAEQILKINKEIYTHHDKVKYAYKTKPGLTKEIVMEISRQKNEPEWMLKKRLEAFEIFKKLPMPKWGPDLKDLDLSKIIYYQKADAKKASSWDDLPKEIKNTFEKLGIPEAERNVLAGTGAQYESEIVYHSLKKQWEDKGVIFLDCDVALKKHEALFKKYFMTSCISPSLHKFSALHAAVWSGGTFIYVPKNVKLTMPLQAYFRMNAKAAGQFEHTLIIIDKGAEVHYIEGCSAPQYNANSLHAGCVEIHVMENAKARYSSIENWSKNTYNLNTKRAIVEKNGTIEWVNGNMGSRNTMLYPTSILKGENAKSDFIGIAFAGKGQNQDTGTKVYHLAKNTTSTVKSKSISKDGGITSYRGLLHIKKGALDSKSHVRCDALMMDSISESNTFPYMDVQEKESDLGHEASVGKINAEQIFYLMSRGLSQEDATRMIVSGFIEPVVKKLPLEYAVELNRLIEIEMESSLS